MRKRVHEEKIGLMDPSVVALASSKFLQNRFSELLRFGKKLLVLGKETIELQGLLGTEPLAENHVAQLYGIREGGVFAEFFQSGCRVVVIHGVLLKGRDHRGGQMKL